MNLTNVAFVGNQVIGGSGGPGYTGGSGFGGGFYNGVDSTATVSDSLFLDNQAEGGAGGSGATGGVAAGGAMANGGGAGVRGSLPLLPGLNRPLGLNPDMDTSSLSVDHSQLLLQRGPGRRRWGRGNWRQRSGRRLLRAWHEHRHLARRHANHVPHRLNRFHTHRCQRRAGRPPRQGGASGQGLGGGLYIDTGADVSSTCRPRLFSTLHRRAMTTFSASTR